MLRNGTIAFPQFAQLYSLLVPNMIVTEENALGLWCLPLFEAFSISMGEKEWYSFKFDKHTGVDKTHVSFMNTIFRSTLVRNFKDNPKALKQGMHKRSAFLLLRMFSLLLTSSLTQLDCFKEGKQREFLEKLFDAVRDEFQLFDAGESTPYFFNSEQVEFRTIADKPVLTDDFIRRLMSQPALPIDPPNQSSSSAAGSSSFPATNETVPANSQEPSAKAQGKSKASCANKRIKHAHKASGKSSGIAIITVPTTFVLSEFPRRLTEFPVLGCGRFSFSKLTYNSDSFADFMVAFKKKSTRFFKFNGLRLVDVAAYGGCWVLCLIILHYSLMGQVSELPDELCEQFPYTATQCISFLESLINAGNLTSKICATLQEAATKIQTNVEKTNVEWSDLDDIYTDDFDVLIKYFADQSKVRIPFFKFHSFHHEVESCDEYEDHEFQNLSFNHYDSYTPVGDNVNPLSKVGIVYIAAVHEPREQNGFRGHYALVVAERKD